MRSKKLSTRSGSQGEIGIIVFLGLDSEKTVDNTVSARAVLTRAYNASGPRLPACNSVVPHLLQFTPGLENTLPFRDCSRVVCDRCELRCHVIDNRFSEL